MKTLEIAVNLLLTFNKEAWNAIYTTVFVSGSSAFLAIVTMVPLGIMISTHDFKFKTALTTIVNSLMSLPTVLIGLIVYMLFTRRGLLGSTGILYTPVAIIVGEILLISPIILSLTINVTASLDARVQETLSFFDLSMAKKILMYMREGASGYLIASLTGWGRAFSEVGIAMMVGGNIAGYTRTMTTAIAFQTSKGEFELGIALGLILFLISIALNLIVQLLKRKNNA